MIQIWVLVILICELEIQTCELETLICELVIQICEPEMIVVMTIEMTMMDLMSLLIQVVKCL